VHAMSDSSSTQQQRLQLLQEAVRLHRKQIDEVIRGQGIDRHLLGLKLIAAEAGLDALPLFTDPLFEKMNYYQLSTSQVSSKYESLLNFGPYVPNGYGVCYNPMPYKILFSVSAWNKDVENFAESFMESLNDAYALLLK